MIIMIMIMCGDGWSDAAIVEYRRQRLTVESSPL